MMSSNSDQSIPGTPQPLDGWLGQASNQAYSPKRLATFCKHVGRPVLHWLTEGSNLKITQHNQTGTGIEVWEVYDPATNETLQFEHEEALRNWIDQRYNN